MDMLFARHQREMCLTGEGQLIGIARAARDRRIDAGDRSPCHRAADEHGVGQQYLAIVRHQSGVGDAQAELAGAARHAGAGADLFDHDVRAAFRARLAEALGMFQHRAVAEAEVPGEREVVRIDPDVDADHVTGRQQLGRDRAPEIRCRRRRARNGRERRCDRDDGNEATSAWTSKDFGDVGNLHRLGRQAATSVAHRDRAADFATDGTSVTALVDDEAGFVERRLFADDLGRDERGTLRPAPRGGVARRINSEIADEAVTFGILVAAVKVSEPAFIWRFVFRSDARFIDALQAVHDLGAAGRDAHRILAFAQVLARGPHGLPALAVVDAAGLIVAVVERDTAERVSVFARQANGIFLRRLDPAARLLIETVAHNDRLRGRGVRRVIVAAGRRAALGEVHHARAVEGDVGDLRARRRFRHVEFDARISAEIAFVIDRHGPHRRTFRDRIVEPAVGNCEREHTPAFVRVAPGGAVLDVKAGAFDIHAARRIVGDLIEPLRLAAEFAVIEDVALLAVHRDAMNEPGFEVGDEELLAPRIEGDVAEAGTGIVAAIVLDVGEQRDGTAGAVDLIDRARRAALAETKLAGHPLCAWSAREQPVPTALVVLRHDLQAEHRRCRDVKIGSFAAHTVVERDAKHLARVTRFDGEGFRRIGKLAARRRAEIGKVEDLEGRAVEVDEGTVERVHVGGDVGVRARPGKAGHGRVTLFQDAALRARLGGEER